LARPRTSSRRCQNPDPHLVSHRKSSFVFELPCPRFLWEFRYDQCGNAKAFGAEAHAMDVAEAEEEEYQLARHFKLHLHTKNMKARNPLSLEPLPKGVRIKKIYADFFGYLYKHMQAFFKERELQGAKIWQDLSQRQKIEFVVTHPNGWTLKEQAFLRKAVVEGGLISESSAAQYVHMLTEAEASVHFVVFHSGGSVETRLEVCLQCSL
jgi:hypothetical protein